MPASMTTVDAILKEVYGPRIVSQEQDETVTLKRIERTSEGVIQTVGGKYVNFPIRTGRNHGISYRAENEQLAPAGQQKYAEVTVPLRFGYGRARVTGQLMDLAETNYQTFASGLDGEMDGLKDDLVKDSNRIAHGDGKGLLCSITDTAVSATHTVDDAKFLEPDMIVDVLLRANGGAVTGGAALTITDVNGNTVTFSGSFTGATTQGVYRQGNYNKEPSGLDVIVDDDTVLHGLDPALQRKWKSEIEHNSGTLRPLSESLMIKVADRIRTASGKRPTVIFGSLGVRRAYFNLLTQQRRYTDTKEYAGGFQGLPFNYGTEIPMVEDVDGPANRLRFVHEPSIKIYRHRPWAWQDKDGSIFKWVNNFDAWEALMKQYWEIGTEQRNAHGELRDITEG